MKFVSVAIVAAFLCVATVSSAPSPSYDEFAFNPLDKIADKLKEYLKKAQCSVNVAGQVVSSNEDLKNEFDELKSVIDSQVFEWQNCGSAGAILDVLKCKVGVLKQLGEAFPGFVQKVAIINKELAKEINEQVAAQCLAESDMPELSLRSSLKSLMSSLKSFVDKLPEQYQCFHDVLAKVSKENGLEEQWSRSQPQLQLHVDNWKGCASVGNKYLAVLCNIKEAYDVNRIFIEYVQILASANPQALMSFAKGVQSCGKAQTDELEEILFDFEDEPETIITPGKVLQKLKCAMNAADEAAKDTKYQQIFDQHKEDMQNALVEIELCRMNEEDMLGAAKCMVKKMVPATVSLNRFLFALLKAMKNDSEFSGRMKSYVKQCFA